MNFFDINAEIAATDSEEIELAKNIDPDITYDDFFNSFLLKNRPCIFRSKITEDWPIKSTWCLENGPNFEFLRDSFGEAVAPIANCNEQYFNSQSKEEMTISDYIDYWIDYRNSSYSADKKVLYLKDWHFVNNYPNVDLYDVPKFFASDWLNEYYTAHEGLKDDYMFVYMGPKGTWTPFHVDVFTSYSWSANICGRKRWLLFPPGQESQFQDNHGKLAYDVTSDEICDTKKYRNHDLETLKCFEIFQEAGEIIFVPSGWHHQVWNVEDTISVNHNWINGCNVRNVYKALEKELEKVEREIMDCRDMSDWAQHCQNMMKASCGLDFAQFYEFLEFIALKRIASIKEKVPVVNFGKWQQGLNHCFFDLRQIKSVLVDFLKNVEESSIFLQDKVSSLLEKIVIVIND